jgi:hypothetical protein
MFQTKFVDKTKTHILCSITFSQNRAVYEIMWKNMVQPDRPHDNIIRRMRFVCWIIKAISYANAPQSYDTRKLPVLFLTKTIHSCLWRKEVVILMCN